MKKLYIIAIVIFAAACVYGIAAEERTFKPHHEDFRDDCAVCHGEANPTDYTEAMLCADCHESGAELAELTSGLGYSNPHTSIHWDETLPCEECHKEHKPMENYCADTCHMWPHIENKY